ncbi:MAG: hypothetical protein GY855_03910 [candidate division Zixibacteria bacterium]|nr:hypothetical protein [candidate division Zixibacteria bacterium]
MMNLFCIYERIILAVEYQIISWENAFGSGFEKTIKQQKSLSVTSRVIGGIQMKLPQKPLFQKQQLNSGSPYLLCLSSTDI